MKFISVREAMRKAKERREAAVMEFFKTHPNPRDEAWHKWAMENGMNPSAAEEQAYKLVSAFVAGGKALKFKGTYDPEQIAKGIKVEMEHLDPLNPYAEMLAERIARDHLAESSEWENPKYYDMLDAMESLMKQGVTVDEVKAMSPK